MGLGIIIPVLIVAVLVPILFLWAHRRFKAPGHDADERATPPAGRLTSNALRILQSPPWRIVYEIGPERLGGVEHVAIGPPGIFAIVTSMDPIPPAPVDAADVHAVARAAILRGALDDALRRCAMTSDRLITVHWGLDETGSAVIIDPLAGATAVDGRHIGAWAASVNARPDAPPLTPAQVDLAWQTVVTAIGRPDPLA